MPFTGEEGVVVIEFSNVVYAASEYAADVIVFPEVVTTIPAGGVDVPTSDTTDVVIEPATELVSRR